MRGLEANAILELKKILRDQYDSGKILAELIQNADDAGAEQFHLGWMSDWPENTHPLFQSPAVVVLNDGRFEDADAEAICHLDVGAKGNDARAIGRFGLGMKSVFNLCEAFFFLASPNQQGAHGSVFAELLNPWASPGLHSKFGPHEDWANLESITLFLIERIESWVHQIDCRRWFCLVLPLRTRGQLDGESRLSRITHQLRIYLQ